MMSKQPPTSVDAALQKSVFVFASSMSGELKSSSARYAARLHGAIPGTPEGLLLAEDAPAAYALPLLNQEGQPLPFDWMARAVESLFAFAQERGDLMFQVPRLDLDVRLPEGQEIASLFDQAPENFLLSGLWHVRTHPGDHRLIVAGSRQIGAPRKTKTAAEAELDRARVQFEREAVFASLDRLTANLAGRIEVVSGMAAGPDTLGGEWAAARGHSVQPLPAQWNLYGKSAGMLRNSQMAWYSTHLVAFWDRTSRGTQHMIQDARRNGLAVRVVTPPAFQPSATPSQAPGLLPA